MIDKIFIELIEERDVFDMMLELNCVADKRASKECFGNRIIYLVSNLLYNVSIVMR